MASSTRSTDGKNVRTKNATKEIRRLYNVKEYFLGAGQFGQVFLAESKADKGIQYAVKVIHLGKMKLTERR